MRSSHVFLLSALWLSQTHALPLPEFALRSYDCLNCEKLSHEPLSSNWSLENQTLKHETMHAQVSFKYQIKATAEQLHEGVKLSTLAPEAIIRISPVHQQNLLNPVFRIKTSQGKELSLQQASSTFSEHESSDELGINSLATAFVQLKSELGFGEFSLFSDSKDNSDYIIQVFDKNSTTYLQLETNKARYSYGELVTIDLVLRNDTMGYPIDLIESSLISTDGQTFPLIFKALSGDHYQAHFRMLSEKNSHGEPWYINAEVTSHIGNQVIKRRAHTGFSYSIPSAAIREIKQNSPGQFAFTASLEIATGSRYALQAVLYGTDNDGQIQPMQMVQAANWFSPGKHLLNFAFEPVTNSTLKPPYYLGYIHLTDYGQLKTVFEYNKPLAVTQLG